MEQSLEQIKRGGREGTGKGSPRSQAIFRPRIGGTIMASAMIAGVAYFATAMFGERIGLSWVQEYPFGLSILVGLAHFLWTGLPLYRGNGIVVNNELVHDLRKGVRIPFDLIVRIDVQYEEIGTPVPTGASPGSGSDSESDVGQQETSPRGMLVRTVVVHSKSGATIQFGDYGSSVRFPEDESRVNLDSAPILLALITAKVGAERLYPSTWKEISDANGLGLASDKKQPGEDELGKKMSLVGLGALVWSLGPKLFSIALKLFKTIKPGAALLSVAVYSLVFSWKFALAIILMVGIHECGHVYAMWRSGVKVKGIYFLPFFGGAAVSEGDARSAAKESYIAINGPVWGTISSLLCAAIYLASDGEWPFFAALAIWGALINVFNLLPIMPLDGGRILGALMSARSWGPASILASLIFGGAIAYLAQLELLVFMVLIGVGELLVRMNAGQLAPAFRMCVEAGQRKQQSTSLNEGAFEHFSHHTQAPFAGRRTEANAKSRHQSFERLSVLAEHEPMSAKQVVLTIAGYFALLLILISTAYFLNEVPGAGRPLDLLR